MWLRPRDTLQREREREREFYVRNVKVKEVYSCFNGIPSHSYGVSLAI